MPAGAGYVWYDHVSVGWAWNNALSPKDPISWPYGISFLPVHYDETRVIAFCPIQSPSIAAGGTWPANYRAPHMNRPQGVPYGWVSPVDARNYLFNDGHVVRLVR